MNQQAPHYAIIGNGRLARHLCHYFQLIQLPVACWHRAQPYCDLTALLDTATHIIIAVSDSAIEFVIDQIQPQNKIIVHCSAALQTPKAWSAHPLQTFSPTLYPLHDYKQIPFIIEAQGPAFEVLLPGLPNPSFSLTQEQKPYYHALCVMANNFTTLLWQKVFHEFENTLCIDKSVLFALLNQTCNNLKTNAADALTGPIARNDHATIQKNLHALKEDSFYDIYAAFIASQQTLDRAPFSTAQVATTENNDDHVL